MSEAQPEWLGPLWWAALVWVTGAALSVMASRLLLLKFASALIFSQETALGRDLCQPAD